MPRRNHPRPDKRKWHKRNRYTDTPYDRDLFCDRCGKVCANTEEDAWSLAIGIFNSRGGVMPQRVYSCGDDGLPPFHWTTRP